MYLRRVSHVLGSRSSAGGRRIAVNFAVAGQLAELRQVGALLGMLLLGTPLLGMLPGSLQSCGA